MKDKEEKFCEKCLAHGNWEGEHDCPPFLEFLVQNHQAQPVSEEIPMGVTNWIEHGKKYGYLDYLLTQERAKSEEKRQEMIEGWREPNRQAFERGRLHEVARLKEKVEAKKIETEDYTVVQSSEWLKGWDAALSDVLAELE